MSTPVFGIDLGTTNSVIAVVRDGIPQVLELDGESIVPSVVGIDPNGNLLVGQHARNQRAAYPERTIASIKRKMGTDEPTKLGERSMSPPEVSAIILKELARRGSIAAGVSVKKVVITVPAFFQDAQRAATRLAGEIAGLEVVRLVNEPTAAALAFEGGEAGRERTLLVYDLGGGTFDVSVVTTDGELTEVLASHGDVHLGGDDIDLLIAKWLAKDLGDPQALDAVAHARLLDAAERAKRQLTEDVEVRVREEFLRGGDDPLHLDVTMSRDDLEELIDPLLDRTLESVHRALSMAGRTLSDIDDIVLVGGQTRTPLVARRLTQLLGKAPRRDVHPDLCVAQGAAIAGAQSAGITTGRVLVDVTPYSFGAGCLGEVDGVMSEHRFEVVIPRGSPLPVVRSETFYTCVDNQEKLDARIFQGESVDARHNILVGRFWVEGLAPAPAGSPLVFKLALGIDGILDVEVLEKSTGMKKRTRIEAATARLSPDELAAARERTRALWAERDDTDDETETGADSDDVVTDFVSPGAPSWVGKLQKACARVTALLDRMGDEDRAETRLMLEDAKQAIAEENEEIALELIDELGDIAHYTEEA